MLRLPISQSHPRFAREFAFAVLVFLAAFGLSPAEKMTPEFSELLSAARVRAATEGRDFVTPDDVKGLAPAVLRHRLMLHPDAELEGVTPDDCIDSVLREAPVPKTAAA